MTLPGSLPVEFLSRDDYYRPPEDEASPWAWSGFPAHGQPGSAC